MTPMVSVRRVITVSDEQLAARSAQGRVVVIDDDAEVLSALSALIHMEGYAVEAYASATSYLETVTRDQPRFAGPCCLLCDVMMPGLTGLELQARIAAQDDMPMLLMSGASGAREVVSAFRAGALDFLVKPIDADVLLVAVARALALSRQGQAQRTRNAGLAVRSASLSARERDIARRVAAGQTNPAIAMELGIALRTVKLHRQHALEKLGAAGLTDLVRIADEGGL
jgi:two-component system, LuxR family, response regulator FixJ